MRIETTCENRKELVKSIGEFLGQKPKYVGPPSYAYKVEGYTIERDGTVVSETEMDGERMRAHLEEHGFAEPRQELESLEVTVPLEDMEGPQLQNLIYMIRSKQYLLNRVVGKDHFSISDDFINTLQTNLPETKEDFFNLCSENAEAISGLSFEDDKVTFIFPGSEKPEKNRAYVELAAMMVAHVREAKRISPKASEPENEKYYLRVWLVRLGLGGKGAKDSRKALLEGLKGHTAFRTLLTPRSTRLDCVKEKTVKAMTNRPRALFGRKLNDLEELREATARAKQAGQQGSLYEVIKVVSLDSDDFKAFAEDFFNEQPWIDKTDGGSNENGEIRCIRVINTDTGERVLINSEGYSWYRYTAIEE